MKRVSLATVLFSIVACGSGGLSAPSPAPGTPSPGLAFALMDSGDGPAAFDTFLGLSTVDGIAIRTSWQAIESTKGTYDWSTIDAAISAAGTYGKRVTIHVIASVYESPPNWIYLDGAQSYSYPTPTGGTKTDPVPWDGVFLSGWSTFVAAMASHLNAIGGMTHVQYVSVAVPVPEMSLVACANGLLAGSLPYGRATYLDAWKTSVQVMQSGFPGLVKLLPVPVSEICLPDHDGPAFYHDILDDALALSTNGFALYATDLNALGSARMNGVLADAGRGSVALQFIWSASNDPSNRMQGSLKSAVCSGLTTYRAVYFEVYKVDLQNPDLDVQGAIQAIHSPILCW